MILGFTLLTLMALLGLDLLQMFILAIVWVMDGRPSDDFDVREFRRPAALVAIIAGLSLATSSSADLRGLLGTAVTGLAVYAFLDVLPPNVIGSQPTAVE